jgi:hypothetical protein
MKKFAISGSGLILVVMLVSAAVALSAYLANFNSRYGTSGTVLNTCNLCHPGGNTGQLNPYATDFLNSGNNFAAIESLDSDGDGYTNIQEINARTFPGDPASHPISVDTQPPVVTNFTIPSPATSLTVPIATFTATDNVGVTGYIVTATSTRPSATGVGWTTSAPVSYTFTSAGTYTLYAWAKDAAENVSTYLSATVTVAPVSSLPILTLTKSGTGSGTITSSPSGIDCGATCSASFTSGTPVTLTAIPGTNSALTSWSGCDSVRMNMCTLTLSANRQVTTTFHSPTVPSDYFTDVQKIYIGYYQRPADPAGLVFWVNGLATIDTNHNALIEQGEDIKWAVDQFAASLESQKIYGGTITSANINMVVDGIYMGLFNRHAEADGLAFWVNSFNTGASTPGTIVWEISRGAQGPDYDCLMNKVTASNRFVHVLDPNLDGVSPFFAPFPAWSNDWLADITSDPNTVPTEATITSFLTGTPYAALTATPYDGLSSSGQGGIFTPSSNVYTLTNTGTTPVNWTASKIQPWISLSAASGTLSASASTQVTVSINTNANTLPVGSYNDVVAFTNTATGSGHARRPVIVTVK